MNTGGNATQREEREVLEAIHERANELENTLVIFDLRGNWMVDWKHTPEAARIADLFGGQTSLPTPYSTLVPVSRVMADIAKLNPQYKVVADAANGLR
ncbi:MAG: hypothetical protein WCC97_08395 [Candidatus Acidiferrales bacterium]